MKIAILGAAGLRTPLIVNAIAARQAQLGITDLALMDIDPERLEITAGLTHALETSGQLAFQIHRTTDARAALHEADFVITTFRVGGMEGRVIDERTALDLGVLGQETTGPGGFAMAMRTLPVLLAYIDLMRQECPQAWLINFANPSGLLTEAIFSKAGWQKAVGICDAPAGMQRIAAALIGARPEELSLDYFGLNHLGWIRSIEYSGKDILPGFLQMLENQGGFADFPFEPAFLSELGLIPNEYLYYYYSSRQAVNRLLQSTWTRGEQLVKLNEDLFADLAQLNKHEDYPGMQTRYTQYLDERGATYMRLELGENEQRPALPVEAAEGGYAGVALDLITALQGEKPAVLTLNVPNQGSIIGMDDEDVVEIPCQVSRGHIQPVPAGKIPGHCLGLMKQVKAYEQLTIEAACEGSYRKAVQALTIHPLVADYRTAKTLVDRYIAAAWGVLPRAALRGST